MAIGDESIGFVRDNPFVKNDVASSGRRLFRRLPASASSHAIAAPREDAHRVVQSSSMSALSRATVVNSSPAPPPPPTQQAPPVPLPKPVIVSSVDDNVDERAAADNISIASSEMEYGPGIVEKLRAKFSRLAGSATEDARISPHAIRKRYPSVDDLLTPDEGRVMSPRHDQPTTNGTATTNLVRRQSRSTNDIASPEVRVPVSKIQTTSLKAEPVFREVQRASPFDNYADEDDTPRPISQLRAKFEQVAKGEHRSPPREPREPSVPRVIRRQDHVKERPMMERRSLSATRDAPPPRFQRLTEAPAPPPRPPPVASPPRTVDEDEEPEFVLVFRRLRRSQGPEPEIPRPDTLPPSTLVPSMERRAPTARLPVFSASARVVPLESLTKGGLDVRPHAVRVSELLSPPDPHSARSGSGVTSPVSVTSPTNGLHSPVPTTRNYKESCDVSPPPEEPKPPARESHEDAKRETVLKTDAPTSNHLLMSLQSSKDASTSERTTQRHFVSLRPLEPSPPRTPSPPETVADSFATSTLERRSQKAPGIVSISIGPRSEEPSRVPVITNSGPPVATSVKSRPPAPPPTVTAAPPPPQPVTVTTQPVAAAPPSPDDVPPAPQRKSLSARFWEQQQTTVTKPAPPTASRKPYGDDAVAEAKKPLTVDVGEEPAPRPTTTVEMKKFVAEEATPPAVPLHNNINGLPQRLVNGAGTSVDDDDYSSTSSSDEEDERVPLKPPTSLNTNHVVDNRSLAFQSFPQPTVAGDGNTVRHTLFNLVQDDDIPLLLEAMSEQYAFVFVDLDMNGSKASTSIIHPQEARVERRKQRKVGGINFVAAPPQVYAYLDETSATRDEAPGTWQPGVDISYQDYQTMCLRDALEQADQQAAELERWRQSLNAANNAAPAVVLAPSGSDFSLGVTNRLSYGAPPPQARDATISV